MFFYYPFRKLSGILRYFINNQDRREKKINLEKSWRDGDVELIRCDFKDK